MKIFVSHSLKDKELLTAIHHNLESHGFELLIAEHSFRSDITISDKIKELIQKCDVGLILLTENGLNSKFVSEEIGYLEGRAKPIIRIIQKGLNDRYSGFKYGTDFIELDPENPSKAQERLTEELLRIKKDKINFRNAWLFAAGIVLLLISSQSDEENK